MAKIADVAGRRLDDYYQVSALLTSRGLAEGRSVLTGDLVWDERTARELRELVFEKPDVGDANFDPKLQQQTGGASDAVRLLAAELRLLHVLPIHDLKPEKKLERITALLPSGVEILPTIAAGLGPGVAKWGSGHPQVRSQYRFIVDVVARLGSLDQSQRAAVVSDPWKFKSLLHDIDPSAAYMEREALLFISHSETFEAVFNGAHKQAIVSAFEVHADGQQDRDRAILAIRDALSAELGPNFSWYRDDVAPRWKTGPSRGTEPSGSGRSSDVPSAETDRRRLRVARWTEHIVAAYEAEGRREELQTPAPDLSTRIRMLPDVLLGGGEPDRTYLAAIGDDVLTNSLRRGAQRVFVAGLFREGGQEAVEVLAAALAPPADLSTAEASLRALYELAERVGTPRAPTPNIATLLLPTLWSLQAPGRYAPYWWAKQYRVLEHLGWVQTTDDWVERYLEHQRCLEALADDPWIAGFAVSGIAGERFLGLDPTLGARASENVEAARTWHPTSGYLDARTQPRAVSNAQSLIGELRNAVSAWTPALSEVLEVKLRPAFPRLTLGESSPYRGDAYVAFAPPGSADDASFRVWVTAESVWVGALLSSKAAAVPDGMEVVSVATDLAAASTRFAGSVEEPGRRLVGRRFDHEEALDRPAFTDEMVTVATELVDLLHPGWGIAGVESEEEPADSAISTLVARWRSETGYPTPGERAELDHLAELTRRLARARLGTLDEEAVRELVSAAEGGAVPPSEVFLRELRSASGAALQRIASSLRHLLWSDLPLAERFDDVHGKSDGLGFPGLEGPVLRRLLSRAPDGWLPILDLEELRSHAARLHLEVSLPSGASLGQEQAAIDAALQGALSGDLGHDSAAMAAFLRWHASVPDDALDPIDPIEQAADDLYVPVTWMRTVEELLRDKGQLILYGPPGTGKTFLAQRLAKALTTSEDDRWLVQFHPSTSYEDFFEGYRPHVDDQKQLTYQLAEGPLARAAKHATANRGRTHVLVIDEINRANLPRVLGELLFLLEYRDESVHTLYRSERPFRLPPNLLIIGTMNTADRSIAMIDAALRRRFHFVPLFPQEHPIDELLERWGADHGLGRRWIDLLAMVNRELLDDLGGPDLQVGPSHFMKEDLTAQQAERTWTYSIFPYIEDQLFGRPDRIKSYRWEQVVARLGALRAAEVADDVQVDGA